MAPCKRGSFSGLDGSLDASVVGLRQAWEQYFSSGFPITFWALEYHTFIHFSERNHYEIKVYTFFYLDT